jgi:small conductance mechanosensitive channel
MINIDQSLRLLIEKLQIWFDATILILPNLILAVLIFILFIWFANLSKKILNKVLSNVRIVDNVKGMVKTLVSITIYLAGAFSALEVLGLEKTVTSILAGAGLIGLAISLAFQNIAANVISGIIISFRHPFYVGDYIQCSDNIFGRVHKINIPNTILLTDEGQFITVPNKDVWEKNIVNFSKSGKREVEIAVGISFHEDFPRVIQVAKQSLDSLPFVNREEDIDVFYAQLGLYSVTLSINFWIQFNEPKEFEMAKSDAIVSILTAFKQQGIEIPYPIQHTVMQ